MKTVSTKTKSTEATSIESTEASSIESTESINVEALSIERAKLEVELTRINARMKEIRMLLGTTSVIGQRTGVTAFLMKYVTDPKNMIKSCQQILDEVLARPEYASNVGTTSVKCVAWAKTQVRNYNQGKPSKFKG